MRLAPALFDTAGSTNDSLAITALPREHSLDGRAGADNLRGDAGDDVYFIDESGDVVVEFVDRGTDLVRSSIDYSLRTTGCTVGSATIRTMAMQERTSSSMPPAMATTGFLISMRQAATGVDLVGVTVATLADNVATLSDGHVITAQAGYVWPAADFI